MTFYNKDGEVISEDKDMVSKLIMIYNSAKDNYQYFIVSKIWLGKDKPDLSTTSISDINYYSFTLIHDLEGKLISKYETSGGQLHRLLILDDTVSQNSNYYDVEIDGKTLKVFSYNRGNVISTKYNITVEVLQSMHELYNFVIRRVTELITHFVYGGRLNNMLSVTDVNTIYVIYYDEIYERVFLNSEHYDPFDDMLEKIYRLEITFKNDPDEAFARHAVEDWRYLRWNDLYSYMETIMPRIVANSILEYVKLNPSQPENPGTGSNPNIPGSGSGGGGGNPPTQPDPPKTPDYTKSPAPPEKPIDGNCFCVRGTPGQGIAGGLYGANRGKNKTHKGVDLGVNTGDPVYAMYSGKITKLVTCQPDRVPKDERVDSLHDRDGYSLDYKGDRNSAGNRIRIYSEINGTTFETTYMHLNQGNGKNLSVGDDITAGDIIGYTGISGNSYPDSPVLHIQMNKKKDYSDSFDPTIFLTFINKTGTCSSPNCVNK